MVDNLYRQRVNKILINDLLCIFEIDDLYNAVINLKEEEKIIILLFYFYELNDREIANRMKLIRRTVNYKRQKALRKLKHELEGNYE